MFAEVRTDRHGWGGRLAAAAVLALLAGWAVADALVDILHLGLSDAESSHVLLVPAVFAWLVWVRRARLRHCDGGGRWVGATALVVGAVCWMAGYRYQVQVLWHGGAVLTVAGAVLVAVGQAAFWRFLPAWVALAFLVPVPARVRLHYSVPLELWTARLTQAAAETVGLSVGRAGNQLSVNGVDVCIAEACNGLRLAFTLLLACYVAVFVRPYRPWVRVAVLAASPAVAVGCNVVRLVPTVWMFGRYPGPVAQAFHDAAGWVMLVVAFGLLTGACGVMGWIGFPVFEDEVEPGRFRRVGRGPVTGDGVAAA